MKLRTKLTLLCGAALFLVAAALSGAMLWQAREQSYENLTRQSEETLAGLITDFSEAVIRNYPRDGTVLSQKAVLKYCFRTCNVEGSALAAMGELLSAPVPLDPRSRLDAHLGDGVQAVRCREAGRDYLILGKAVDLGPLECQVYLLSDASFIRQSLWELAVRYLTLALFICGLGLMGVWLLIRRALAPLSQLQKAADRITAGHYGERAYVSSKDEVGLLAGNFNRMADAVQTHIETLTEQNARQRLFIGGVTHEFKTPLTSLLLNVDTLRTVYLPEDKREDLLGSMEKQLRWLEQMVKKLLELLTLGKNVRKEPASVPELLEKVRKLTEPVMAKYGTTLEISCEVDSLPMDPALMCSALVNLVENSAKASFPGQSIRLRAAGKVLEVSDRGRGISEADLGRVAEPFYMGDPSRSKANGGFGLGLALVKEIADVHGAALELSSKPGAGTTVRLVFPADGNETVMEP